MTAGCQISDARIFLDLRSFEFGELEGWSDTLVPAASQDCILLTNNLRNAVGVLKERMDRTPEMVTADEIQAIRLNY